MQGIVYCLWGNLIERLDLCSALRGGGGWGKMKKGVFGGWDISFFVFVFFVLSFCGRWAFGDMVALFIVGLSDLFFV